ncbi:exported hypothetical protein [Xanthomonas citri pv. fuscans]|nr:exported hypothetical protein [Xanthomonas citri pv. fuscans]SOO08456.1 exported hypothetical protein [Xanthomonas citri pv. fuscans]SOO16734.1 exported hypothetical protein [Xanthomonas citri pv. fuscans]SOO43911.1 exported hypothetical protein [Xanthomonas citri pv. fuscans]
MTLPVVLLHPRGLPRAIATALLCLAALPGMAATHFASAFEDGAPLPMPATDTAVQVAIGAGPAAPYAAKPNAGYSGAHALHYASNGAGGRRVLFTTDLLIETQTTLRGWSCRKVSATTMWHPRMSRWTWCWTTVHAFLPAQRAINTAWHWVRRRKASRRRCTRSSGRASKCGWEMCPGCVGGVCVRSSWTWRRLRARALPGGSTISPLPRCRWQRQGGPRIGC